MTPEGSVMMVADHDDDGADDDHVKAPIITMIPATALTIMMVRRAPAITGVGAAGLGWRRLNWPVNS